MPSKDLGNSDTHRKLFFKTTIINFCIKFVVNFMITASMTL